MQITYFDGTEIKDQTLSRSIKTLEAYRAHTLRVVDEGDFSQPESSLATFADEKASELVYEIATHFEKIKHVVLVGIGGQSLGIEAIHSVLYNGGPELHVLDTVAAHEVLAVMEQLDNVKNPEHIAICISSKSGATTEVLTNASTILDLLEKKFGKKIHQRVVYIGTEGNDLLKYGKKMKSHVLPFQKIVGGRYSVFTASGLLPLLLLRHDIEALLEGLNDATTEHFESAVAESASRLYLYMKGGVRDVNFFAFDTRLVRLGKWYRQLTAESLGKAKTKDNKQNKLGFIPTISTPVELHSIGQLYFSGFPGVYTDFVSFDIEDEDLLVPKKSSLAGKLKGKSHNEILTATYAGVIAAYQATELPYRSTVLEDDLSYSLGLFMGMRMLETMYVAHLTNVDAFNQPNVELYKDKTRSILGI